ncbi:MAG: hypothetical protein IMX02_12605 [Limnochordaceae bacterium]|nr:hypothetical protein [Limnochordaceae bacterium]
MDLAAGSGERGGRGGALAERAPAKLNLVLRVLGRRPDGYHELDGVMVSVDPPADEVRAEYAPGLAPGRLRVRAEGPLAPWLAESGVALEAEADLGQPGALEHPNLVVRAAAALHRAHPPKPGAAGHGVELRLVKAIPVGAGLGGGSADAAATLRALNRLWNLGLATRELEEVAARVGADVAFCVRGGAQRAGGAGEVLRHVCVRLQAGCVVVVPEQSASTREAYRLWDAGERPAHEARSLAPVEAAVDALARGDLAGLAASLWNDLALAAARLCRSTERLQRILRDVPACMGVSVTGSGCAVFGLVDPGALQTCREAVERRLREEGLRAWVFAARIPSGGGGGL